MMKKSNNDSGLRAKRSHRLLAAGLVAIVMVVLAACSTKKAVPLDDAYYWPSAIVAPVLPDTVPAAPAPTMEILDQQDTTITVRIKR